MSEVSLRPMRDADLPSLSATVSTYNDFGPTAPPTKAAPYDLETRGAFVVEAGGDPVGTVSWYPKRWGPNESSSCTRIGVLLLPEHRGRGIGTTAQRELVTLLFRHTAVHRVEAYTDVRNIAEQRALEKAGLMREGVVRGSQFRDGRYNDGYLYGILRTDLDDACPGVSADLRFMGARHRFVGAVEATGQP